MLMLEFQNDEPHPSAGFRRKLRPVHLFVSHATYMVRLIYAAEDPVQHPRHLPEAPLLLVERAARVVRDRCLSAMANTLGGSFWGANIVQFQELGGSGDKQTNKI